MNIKNALSIDVEDYFQVQALASAFPRDGWAHVEARVERNTNTIMEVFDAAGVRATFFTLGWVGEKFPGLVQRIAAQGHEVASHGYEHARVDHQSPDEFRNDVRRTKIILEDISGQPVSGYRAATFSMTAETDWAHKILQEEGYRYSSSIYPVKSDNYAYPNAPRFAFQPQNAGGIWEIPIATVRVLGRNFPVGGGGYFRFLPYELSRAAINRINQIDRQPATFYLHPWEVDPEQPYIRNVSAKSRFRHYLNLSKTKQRLTRLVNDFKWDRMDKVYLDQLAE